MLDLVREKSENTRVPVPGRNQAKDGSPLEKEGDLVPMRVTSFRREELPLHLERAAQAHEGQNPGVRVTAMMIELEQPTTEAEQADELLTLGGTSAREGGVPVAVALGVALAIGNGLGAVTQASEIMARDMAGR